MTLTQSQLNSHGKSDKLQSFVIEPSTGRELNQHFEALRQTFEKIHAISSICQRQFTHLNSAQPHEVTKPDIKPLYTDWPTAQEG